MRKLTTIAIAAAALISLPSAAWAMGTLAISSVMKLDTAAGANIIVTSTCKNDKGSVNIWAHEVSTLAQTKIFRSKGGCKKLWASSGKTVTVPINSLPSGTYHIILRQDGEQSAPSDAINLP